MAKLTFIDGAASATTTYAMNINSAFAGGTVGNIGMWVTEPGTTTVTGDHLDGISPEFFLDNAGGQLDYTICPDVFQITQQTTSGYPYASPLIEKSRVKRVTHTTYLASAKATTGNRTINNASALNSATWGIKIVKLSGYSDYNEFLNPTGEYDDRVGAVRSYEFVSDATGTVAEIATGLVAAINADSGAWVTAANAGAGEIQITAKDNGTAFKVIDTSTTTMTYASGTLVGNFGFTEGVGNGFQAVEAEKKSLHHRGAHHNRMYFADSVEQFASASKTYDIFTIECDGGVRQDATNAKDDLIIELWVPSGYTDGGGIMNDFWGPATSTTTAGDTMVLYQK
jgi:hypothetical protein